VFEHDDRSVSEIKDPQAVVSEKYGKNKEDDPERFDPVKFQKMWTRYMQVLDTDYNYILTYSCQDSA
jgi:hypothetical protein